jgi:hypothetical protein
MRTLGFRTHVLLVLAGAIGVLSSLSRPWYGPAPAPLPDNSQHFDVHGPLYGVLDALKRWVTAPDGTTGWDALGTSGTVLAGLALASALCAVGCVAPAVQGLVSSLLRYVSFVTFAVVLWRVLDAPGPNGAHELRLGALVALVSATFVWVSAQGVANAPMRRRVTPPSYTPPPPPPVFEYDAR